jgi:hypothetical protein
MNEVQKPSNSALFIKFHKEASIRVIVENVLKWADTNRKDIKCLLLLVK